MVDNTGWGIQHLLFCWYDVFEPLLHTRLWSTRVSTSYFVLTVAEKTKPAKWSKRRKEMVEYVIYHSTKMDNYDDSDLERWDI